MLITAKKNMILLTLISLIILSVSGTIYYFTRNQAIFSVAVTFGTIFYHFAMRLAVGYFINAKYHNRMDYTKKWFTQKSFEQKLYKIIKVKEWKKHLPTFDPQNFDLRNRSAADIVQVTCQAEVVHEVNMILSFVPVLFSVRFGSIEVFLLTSCAAFLFDGIFVMIQRYNRPRLIRLMRKQNPDS